jgi:endonuclease/exonuclease/phosphatase family metal-dependent hydrolase
MKKIVILFLFVSCGLYSQVILLSWNIENLGSSKSESEITFMAKTVKDYDILAIQEVVAGDGEAQAVAKLAAALNRMGT